MSLKSFISDSHCLAKKYSDAIRAWIESIRLQYKLYEACTSARSLITMLCMRPNKSRSQVVPRPTTHELYVLHNFVGLPERIAVGHLD